MITQATLESLATLPTAESQVRCPTDHARFLALLIAVSATESLV